LNVLSNKQKRSEACSAAVIGGTDAPSKCTKLLRYAADVCFFVYLVTNLLFAHSTLSQLTMVLFGLSVAVLFFDSKRFYFHGWFLTYLLLAVWGAVGAAAGWAVDRTQAMDMVQTLVINFVFLLCLYQYFVQRGSLAPCFNAYLIASALTMALVVVISGPSIIHYRFGQLAGVNPNLLASFLLIACAGALHLLFEKKEKWFVYAPLTLLFFAGVLLTGSRKGLLGLAIVMVLYVLWSDRKHIVRNLIVLFLLGAAGCAALFFVPKLYEVIGERLIWTVKSVLGLVGEEGMEWSMMERTEMADAAKALFLARPLTGWGLDCYRFASEMGTYAHNNYLELLADGGLPALLLYYVPILLLIIRGFRCGGEDGAVRLGTSLLLMLVLLGIAVVSYYERVDLVVIPIALAALRLKDLSETDGTKLWSLLTRPFAKKS